MHIATTDLARTQLLRRIRTGGYDFIQVDLLWVWPLVRQCLRDLEPGIPRPRIIYSSQNIEQEMKRQILSQLGAPQHVVDRYGAEVLELERDMVRSADLLFAVSIVDQRYLNTIGERNDCVLAKNGTSLSTVPDETTEHWRPILPRDPFAVFISSAHPPNAVGFFSVFGSSMAFLPPDCRLVIAGGVTALVESCPPYKRWAAINDARTLRLGIIDDIGIAALRRFAHVFVLPITAGGGSNIKTAEALMTGTYVLGTSTAFRGFEDFMGEPGVYVEDDPTEFRSRLVQLLGEERPILSQSARDRRRRLLWESTLAPMPAHVLATN